MTASTLGWNALIVPSVMIVSGVILWIIGISLTPNLIDITSIQYVPDVPLILSLIAPFVQDRLLPLISMVSTRLLKTARCYVYLVGFLYCQFQPSLVVAC